MLTQLQLIVLEGGFFSQPHKTQNTGLNIKHNKDITFMEKNTEHTQAHIKQYTSETT